MYIRISKKHGEIPNRLTIGKLYKVVDGSYTHDNGFVATYMGSLYCNHIDGYWEVVTTNRQYLQEFLKINNIKKTLVSKALGKSENWLTQMANDTRRDMTEETLQRILKMLHIDWSSDKTLHVKTKGYVPYTTKPCTYHTDMHKERLQKAFWNGEVTL